MISRPPAPSALLALAALLASSGLGQRPAEAQQPPEAQQRPAQSVLKAYPLKFTNAISVQSVIQTVLAEKPGVRMAVDAHANLLVAWAAPEDHQKIEELLRVLDSSNEAAERPLRIISLENIKADGKLQELLELVVTDESSFAIDEERGLVIMSARQKDVDVAESLLRELAHHGQRAKVDDTLRVRVVWLASGVSAESSKEPPEDLAKVLAELKTLGLSDMRLVAQTLISSAAGERPFQAGGTALLQDAPCSFEVQGTIAPAGPMRKLDIEIDVNIDQLQSQGAPPQRVCAIDTTLTVPLGHSVVLGTTPSLNSTSVFVIQLLKAAGQ